MTNPESMRFQWPIYFGTVIISKDHNNGEPSLVVEVKNDGTWFETMLFVPEEGRYGLPSSVHIDNIDIIVGHQYPYEQVVEALALAFTPDGANPSQETYDIIHRLTSEYAPHE